MKSVLHEQISASSFLHPFTRMVDWPSWPINRNIRCVSIFKLFINEVI
jgi:hypothetical protein